MSPPYTDGMANDDLAASIDELERQRDELARQRKTRKDRFDAPLETERSRLDEALRGPLETLSKIARRQA